MIVQRVETSSFGFEVTGMGYQPSGEFVAPDISRVEQEPEVQKLI